jgi:hypothetical protein
MPLDYEKRDGVAYITLNTPAKANFLDKRPPERRIGRSDASRAAQMLSQAALGQQRNCLAGQHRAMSIENRSGTA